MPVSVVTTSLRADQEIIHKAERIAGDLALPYVPRTGETLNEWPSCLVVEKSRILLLQDGQPLFWHPGTAQLKIKGLLRGDALPILTATDIQPGDTILDATLGFAADALVMAWAAGREGHIIGLESSPILALLTADGLTEYEPDIPDLKEAMRRITVTQVDALEYLTHQPDRSFDVVYFDPMFQKPRNKSSAMNAMRHYADHRPLTSALVREALRVARRRVVIKERYGSPVFAQFHITEYVGQQRPNAVLYGILRSIHEERHTD